MPVSESHCVGRVVSLVCVTWSRRNVGPGRRRVWASGGTDYNSRVLLCNESSLCLHWLYAALLPRCAAQTRAFPVPSHFLAPSPSPPISFTPPPPPFSRSLASSPSPALLLPCLPVQAHYPSRLLWQACWGCWATLVQQVRGGTGCCSACAQEDGSPSCHGTAGKCTLIVVWLEWTLNRRSILIR